MQIYDKSSNRVKIRIALINIKKDETLSFSTKQNLQCSNFDFSPLFRNF